MYVVGFSFINILIVIWVLIQLWIMIRFAFSPTFLGNRQLGLEKG